jgi:hypothetical protein
VNDAVIFTTSAGLGEPPPRKSCAPATDAANAKAMVPITNPRNRQHFVIVRFSLKP